mmetsp:Transcript_331/g.759  ORF Transcript_331/g.759 Transcript_331/m.759 type:complete len:245 (+) Transcript_331:268-1002(+)
MGLKLGRCTVYHDDWRHAKFERDRGIASPDFAYFNLSKCLRRPQYKIVGGREIWLDLDETRRDGQIDMTIAPESPPMNTWLTCVPSFVPQTTLKKHIMRAALKKAVEKGTLVQVKASYKISQEHKKAVKAAAIKAKKPPKKAAPKKKAAAKKKTPAKKAASTATKKSTTATKKKPATAKKGTTTKTATKKKVAAPKKDAAKKPTKAKTTKAKAKTPKAKTAAPKKKATTAAAKKKAAATEKKDQ